MSPVMIDTQQSISVRNYRRGEPVANEHQNRMSRKFVSPLEHVLLERQRIAEVVRVRLAVSPYNPRQALNGAMMQSLRTTTGLTQAGLADRLEVSWRAVAEWDAGPTSGSISAE